MSRIIAIANQKGGVGKTTTAINLGTALAAVARKVLLVDLDPQGNASTGLGIEPGMRGLTSYDLLIDSTALNEVMIKTRIENLMLVPANNDLSGADVELAASPRRGHRLRDALRSKGGVESFDYILIDCPPSLNLLTINAMIAADKVLVPLQSEFFALEGLSQLLETISSVKKTHNPGLEIMGVVLTMYDKRNSLSGQVAEDVREYLGDVVYSTIIPRNVRLSEAPSHGLPAILYDHSCPGSQAYIALASEMLKRVEGQIPEAI